MARAFNAAVLCSAQISAPQSKESRPRTPTQEPPAAAASPSDSFTQRNSHFSKEALQVKDERGAGGGGERTIPAGCCH